MNAFFSRKPIVEPLEILMTAAQKGDLHAFEAVVEQTHGGLRKVAITVVPTSQVEDVVQEAYLTAFQKLGCLRDPSAARAWLTRIVLNIAYDWARRSKHEPTARSEVPEAPAPEPLDLVILRDALNTLSRNDRNILILREYLEMSYDEIASVLELSEGSVKSRLFYARKRMREVLGKT